MPGKNFLPLAACLTILVSLSIILPSNNLISLSNQKSLPAPQILVQAPIVPIFTDNFDSDLSQWSIDVGNSNNTVVLDSTRALSGSALKISLNDSSKPVTLTHQFNSPQQGNLTVYFYDDYPSDNGFYLAITNNSFPTDSTNTQMVALGVYPNVFKETYWYRAGANSRSNDIDTHIKRSKGWHRADLFASDYGSYAKIDGINLTYLPTLSSQNIKTNPLFSKMTGFTKIVFVSAWNAKNSSYFDNLTLNSLPLPPSFPDNELTFVDYFLSQPESYSASTGQGPRPYADRALALAIKGRYSEAAKYLNDIVNNSSFMPWTPGWGSSTPAYLIGLTSWISWDHLDQNLQDNLTKKILIPEAEYQSNTNPSSGYIDDTQAESNGWVAGYLALASQMMPGQPNADRWEKMGRLWAFHTFTNSLITYPDKNQLPGINPVTTQTLYSDYTLDNHKFSEHQSYVLCAIEGLAKGAIAYQIAGKPIPDEFKHNVAPVWTALQPYLDWNSLLYTKNDLSTKYGGKDDWGHDMSDMNDGFAYAAYITGDTAMMEKLYRMQFYLKDYNTYPYKTYPSISNQTVWVDPQIANSLFYQPNLSAELFSNSAIASKRHILSYLLFKNNLHLLPIYAVKPTPPAGQPSFTEDFEGDLSAWSIDNSDSHNTIITDSTIAKSGKALKINLNNPGSITMIHQFNSAQQGTLTTWFYDDLPNNNGFYLTVTNDAYPNDRNNTKMVALGIFPAAYLNTYWYRTGSNQPANNINTYVQRTQGWHKIEFIVNDDGGYAVIDGVKQKNDPTIKSFTKIAIVSAWTPTHTNYFDSFSFVPLLASTPSITVTPTQADTPTPTLIPNTTPVPSITTTPNPKTSFVENFETDLSQWQIINATPTVNTIKIDADNAKAGNSLHINLADPTSAITLIHGFSSPQQGTFMAWFYDDYPNNNGFQILLANDSYPTDLNNTKMAAIGIYPAAFASTYWSRYGANVYTNNTNTNFSRVNAKGWHKLVFSVNSSGVTASIDDKSIPGSNLVTSFTKIAIVSFGSPEHQTYIDSINFQPL